MSTDQNMVTNKAKKKIADGIVLAYGEFGENHEEDD